MLNRAVNGGTSNSANCSATTLGEARRVKTSATCDYSMRPHALSDKQETAHWAASHVPASSVYIIAMLEYIQVVTTTEHREDAERIARELVEQRLAGLRADRRPGSRASIAGATRSKNAQEWQCWAKSRSDLYADVEQTIRRLASLRSARDSRPSHPRRQRGLSGVARPGSEAVTARAPKRSRHSPSAVPPCLVRSKVMSVPCSESTAAWALCTPHTGRRFDKFPFCLQKFSSAPATCS